VAFSPDGGLLAAARRRDNLVLLYDLRAGRTVCALGGCQGPVQSLAFSGDGRTLAAGGDDRAARLWDTATGRERDAVLLGHAEAVTAVAFSPDGRTVVTAGLDGTVRLWDAVTGQALAELPAHPGPVFGAAFAPDGRTLYSAGDGPAGAEVRAWQAAGGE
jgi:WD40 repeat protein